MTLRFLIRGIPLLSVLAACGGSGGGDNNADNTSGPVLPAPPAFARYAFHGNRTYRIDNDSGHLIPVRVNYDFGSARFLAILPSGDTLYAPCDINLVCQATVGARGNLEPIAAAIASGAVTLDVDITPDGRFLYAVNQGANTVAQFAVATDGTLSALPGSPLPTHASQHSGLVITGSQR